MRVGYFSNNSFRVFIRKTFKTTIMRKEILVPPFTCHGQTKFSQHVSAECLKKTNFKNYKKHLAITEY